MEGDSPCARRGGAAGTGATGGVTARGDATPRRRVGGDGVRPAEATLAVGVADMAAAATAQCVGDAAGAVARRPGDSPASLPHLAPQITPIKKGGYL